MVRLPSDDDVEAGADLHNLTTPSREWNRASGLFERYDEPVKAITDASESTGYAPRTVAPRALTSSFRPSTPFEKRFEVGPHFGRDFSKYAVNMRAQSRLPLPIVFWKCAHRQSNPFHGGSPSARMAFLPAS